MWELNKKSKRVQYQPEYIKEWYENKEVTILHIHILYFWWQLGQMWLSRGVRSSFLEGKMSAHSLHYNMSFDRKDHRERIMNYLICFFMPNWNSFPVNKNQECEWTKHANTLNDIIHPNQYKTFWPNCA